MSAGAFYGPQAYSYAAARPAMYVDPDGLFNTCEVNGVLRPECVPEGTPPPTPAPSPAPAPSPGGAGRGIGGALACWLLGICDSDETLVPDPGPFDPGQVEPFVPPAPLPGPAPAPSGNPTPVPGCQQEKSCEEQYTDCTLWCRKWAVAGRHRDFARCIRTCNAAHDECVRLSGR